jgi:hypothetical protein
MLCFVRLESSTVAAGLDTLSNYCIGSRILGRFGFYDSCSRRKPEDSPRF